MRSIPIYEHIIPRRHRICAAYAQVCAAYASHAYSVRFRLPAKKHTIYQFVALMPCNELKCFIEWSGNIECIRFG